MRRLWAVARTTLFEAVRTRTVAVVVVVLVLVVGLGPFFLRGTGTLAERVQLVLSYSLGAIGFLLSIMTIFLSASTLAGDLREKRIETIATKPVARWQILVGKWLAIMLLNVALVVLGGGATYVLVRHVVGRPSAAKNDEERTKLTNEIYTARHTIKASLPDVLLDPIIDREIARKREAGTLGEGFNEATYRRTRRQELWVSYNTLRPGGVCLHKFEGVVPARPDQDIYVRYKLMNVGASGGRRAKGEIALRWIASPDRTLSSGRAVGRYSTVVSLDDYHEFTVPASLIGPEQTLYVLFENLTNRPGAVPSDVYAAFPAEEGVQVLYKADTFEWNFVRALLLVLVRLAFLSALALAAASVLSFPVATLVVVFVFACALLVDQFVALAAPLAGADERPVFATPLYYRVVFKVMSAVVPNFGRYDGTREVATGGLVPWSLVLRGLGIVGIIYSGVVMVLGCLYFRGRELAASD